MKNMTPSKSHNSPITDFNQTQMCRVRYDYRLLLKILSNTDENTNNQRNINLGHVEENQNRRKIKKW